MGDTARDTQVRARPGVESPRVCDPAWRCLPITRFVTLAAAALLLLALAVSAPAQEAEQVAGEQLRDLNRLSSDLVARARSGSAPATPFRIDATVYREALRQVMLLQPPPTVAPQALLIDMVRMAALLNAAAECKTGRYITCPADLMTSLESQQGRLDAAFATLAAGAP